MLKMIAAVLIALIIFSALRFLWKIFITMSGQ
jgi:hypothetical protein